MSTVARPVSSEGSHFYLKDGTPYYECPYKDPSKGMRKTTLADARKVGALPSVTTVLSCLNRPALTTWLQEQACLAVLTAPRNEGESLDDFVKRVLHTEKQQDQEAQVARDLGTDIHAAIEDACNDVPYLPEFKPYVEPAWAELMKLGRVVKSETIVVGDGYAGKLDCLLENDEAFTLVDFKTTKSVPKEAYNEHRLQLAAYANAHGSTGAKHIRTANLYISTKEAGKVVLCHNGDWQTDYKAFEHLLAYWMIANDYRP